MFVFNSGLYISVLLNILSQKFLFSSKLHCLTNIQFNLFLVFCIIFTLNVIYNFKKCLVILNTTFLLQLAYSDPQLKLALTNSLFIIHPILLYSFIAVCYRSYVVYNLTILKYKASFGIISALILGGYWSVQELNWGGWWNWDVLETGSAAIALLFIINLHTKKSFILHVSYNKKYAWANTTVFYLLLNKLGIATSIHSFSLSAGTQQAYTFFFIVIIHYLTYYFLNKNKHFLKFPILLSIFYCYFSSFFFLKLPSVWLCAFLLHVSLKRKRTHGVLHISLFYCLIICFLFNFNNNSLVYLYPRNAICYTYGIYSYLPYSLSSDYSSSLSAIWKEMLLEKTRFFISTISVIKNTKSLNLVNTYTVFLK